MGWKEKDQKLLNLLLTFLSEAVNNLGQHTRFWNLSHQEAVKAQIYLRI